MEFLPLAKAEGVSFPKIMNGKGDSPRNCFSKQFKNNYDDISWDNSKSTDSLRGCLKGTFEKFIKEQADEVVKLEQNRKDRI